MCKNQLRTDLTSENSDNYKLKTALLDNSKLEDFLLFLRNFQMTLEESGILASGGKIQYLCTLVRGKVLQQLETLSVEVGSTT